jgi:hypothetical protein
VKLHTLEVQLERQLPKAEPPKESDLVDTESHLPDAEQPEESSFPDLVESYDMITKERNQIS